MFFEDDEKKYKMVAPDIDGLLCWFDKITWLPEEPAELLTEKK